MEGAEAPGLPQQQPLGGHRGTSLPREPGEIIQRQHKSVVAGDVCETPPNVLRESVNEFTEPRLMKELML